MNVLVDTSIWVDYFRGAKETDLDFLIQEDLVAVNPLILTELLPPLRMKRHRKVVSLLKKVLCLDMAIDWDDVVEMQVTCLRHGINRVGIPKLLIAQSAIEHGVELYTADKHFELMAKHLPLKLYGV
jgi:predicted nucleic acid-binding protein